MPQKRFQIKFIDIAIYCNTFFDIAIYRNTFLGPQYPALQIEDKERKTPIDFGVQRSRSKLHVHRGALSDCVSFLVTINSVEMFTLCIVCSNMISSITCTSNVPYLAIAWSRNLVFIMAQDQRIRGHYFFVIKAAESVSFRNYCMWIFLFNKKLHMSKLSIKVELIPQHKLFYELRLPAFVRNTTLSVAFYSLYNSVTEEI